MHDDLVHDHVDHRDLLFRALDGCRVSKTVSTRCSAWLLVISRRFCPTREVHIAITFRATALNEDAGCVVYTEISPARRQLGCASRSIDNYQCRRLLRRKPPPIIQLRGRRIGMADRPLDILELGAIL